MSLKTHFVVVPYELFSSRYDARYFKLIYRIHKSNTILAYIQVGRGSEPLILVANTYTNKKGNGKEDDIFLLIEMYKWNASPYIQNKEAWIQKNSNLLESKGSFGWRWNGRDRNEMREKWRENIFSVCLAEKRKEKKISAGFRCFLPWLTKIFSPNWGENICYNVLGFLGLTFFFLGENTILISTFLGHKKFSPHILITINLFHVIFNL